MYYKIDEEVLKEIQNITNTNYEKEGEFLSIESINDIIEDLLLEIEHLEEELEYLKEDLEQNYRPIPLSEQYGIRNSDFL